mmetsp:Transcript_6283/g.13582  ORF Transcript_6283/g.13582 Transcript_6283/m.13582 type:complete len:380 (+) Transcript_6283:248-1387(+)
MSLWCRLLRWIFRPSAAEGWCSVSRPSEPRQHPPPYRQSLWLLSTLLLATAVLQDTNQPRQGIPGWCPSQRRTTADGESPRIQLWMRHRSRTLLHLRRYLMTGARLAGAMGPARSARTPRTWGRSKWRGRALRNQRQCWSQGIDCAVPRLLRWARKRSRQVVLVFCHAACSETILSHQFPALSQEADWTILYRAGFDLYPRRRLMGQLGMRILMRSLPRLRLLVPSPTPVRRPRTTSGPRSSGLLHRLAPQFPKSPISAMEMIQHLCIAKHMGFHWTILTLRDQGCSTKDLCWPKISSSGKSNRPVFSVLQAVALLVHAAMGASGSGCRSCCLWLLGIAMGGRFQQRFTVQHCCRISGGRDPQQTGLSSVETVSPMRVT